MNGYQVKSQALVAAISAVHQELSEPVLVASYANDYDQLNDQELESALMGIAQEITYPLWVEWQNIQHKDQWPKKAP